MVSQSLKNESSRFFNLNKSQAGATAANKIVSDTKEISQSLAKQKELGYCSTINSMKLSATLLFFEFDNYFIRFYLGGDDFAIESFYDGLKNFFHRLIRKFNPHYNLHNFIIIVKISQYRLDSFNNILTK